MQFGFLLEQVVNGLVLGGYYLLIALGLSLIFSVGGVVNLAHGAFYALGAYASVEITKYLGFGPAVVLSPLAVALLGILFERYILHRFFTARPILSLLGTVGRGVGMAAMGGAFFAPITIGHPAMGAEIITVAFVVVVIGGLGSFWGVVIAALLVGVVRGITIHFLPAAGEASIYVLMFLVLLVRPRGLLGERIEKFE